jgi:cytoskeletal protein CcmA (bactofilin family)
MNYTNFKELNFSLLGKKTKITGDLSLEGDTVLAGSLTGTITVKDQGNIIIEQTATIEGDIYCNDIEIFGSFSGSINASGTLTIRSSADVAGKISASKMSIYPGAILNMEGSAEALSDDKK